MNPMTALLPAIVLALAGAAHAQTATLTYTPPANSFKSALGADSYDLNGTNASVRIYQFRKFDGDIRRQFTATRLREWVDPMFHEENVAGQVALQNMTVPGADFAIIASFTENRVGLARPHNRMLIVKGNEAALVDASAGTLPGWQAAMPRLNQMAATFKVEAAPQAAPLSIDAGNSVAGLYQGMKPKYVATMQNITGYAQYQTALHFYLFSANGRVYRAYDTLNAPGGKFDFDAAERRDPENSGRYTVDKGRLIIKMKGDNAPIVTSVPKDGVLTIYDVAYRRQ